MKKLSSQKQQKCICTKAHEFPQIYFFFNSQVPQPRPEFRQLLFARRRSLLDVRDCIGDFHAVQIGLLMQPLPEEEEEWCARELQEEAVKNYLGERDMFDLWEIKAGNIRLHFYLWQSRQALELWELLWGEQFGDHHIQDWTGRIPPRRK